MTFEPDRREAAGNRDAFRPLVIAPQFPARPRAAHGDQLSLEIVAIGPHAAASVPHVAAAAAVAGSHDRLGPDRVPFTLSVAPRPIHTTTVHCRDLPRVADTTTRIHDVTIRLTGPLFLRERPSRDASRRAILAPTLGHLLRASVRVAREVFGETAIAPAASLRGLHDLADRTCSSAKHLAPFRQVRVSNRSSQRLDLRGVSGSLHFKQMPACLLPWLELGGLLHVGGHRIAGAGGWDIIVGDACPPSPESP